MGKRIGTEAKIISLFLTLTEDSQRIVLDVLKNARSKSAPSAVKKSSRKTLTEAVSTGAGMESVLTAVASGKGAA